MTSLLFIFSTPEIQKKEFYSNDNLKAEGWELNRLLTDYRIFYHPNGSLLKKDPYFNNQMHGYWYFYSEENKLIKKDISDKELLKIGGFFSRGRRL